MRTINFISKGESIIRGEYDSWILLELVDNDSKAMPAVHN